MDKNMNLMLGTARALGAVKTVEMREAGEWVPKHIEMTGQTNDGERFTLTLCVGKALGNVLGKALEKEKEDA